MRRRWLGFQRGGSHGKRTVRHNLQLLCNLETGENRFAQAQLFSNHKLGNLGNVTIRAEAAQERFQLVRQRKRRLRRLRRVAFLGIRDAHLKLRRHRTMAEDVNQGFAHGLFAAGGSVHSSSRTSGRAPKNSGRKFFSRSANLASTSVVVIKKSASPVS